jgi:hypothetical protein
VLTDQNGNPVNGVRAMQIKIYDAPTGGTLLYSEDLGNVPVQDGIYSFSFGANGTSNALTTETVAIANGTVSTFQKVLAAPTVVAGSVTVTDGTYTWDQTNGSSNENDFSVAYSPNLRRVTVTYYNGAPAAGKTITATYRSPNAGVTGSLADIGKAWSEVSIGGSAQNPRQKILTTPFALYSKQSETLAPKTKEVLLQIENVQNTSQSGINGGTITRLFYVPTDILKIETIEFLYKLSVLSYAGGETSGVGAKLDFKLFSFDPQTNITQSMYHFSDQVWVPQIATKERLVSTGSFVLEPDKKIYKIEISLTNIGASNWGSRNSGDVKFVKIRYTTND